MIKRFPSSRNQRSKGIKIKHVLQVLLLVGVSFWLIYQVKHNHDKKREFDKHGEKLSVGTETNHIVKLGRKDLHPIKEEVNQDEKHEEEEEDEHIVEDEEKKREPDEQEERNKHETKESEDNVHEGREQVEEENKHGAVEREEDKKKSEEMEDGSGGGDGDIDENDQEKQAEEENNHGAEEHEEDENKGEEGVDDETDENDQEKPEVDVDHDDEIIDEEKEKEEGGDENENEDKEDEEKGGLVENNHEAREEHYKGDDASSAVAHDTHATSTEAETVNLENSDVNLEMNITKPENKTTYSDENNTNRNDSDSKATEGEAADIVSTNGTAGKETGNDDLSNTTAKTNTDSHLQVSSKPTVTITEASSNLTEAGADISSSSEQNKSVIVSISDHAQNTTDNITISGDIKNVQTGGLEQNGNIISEEKLPNNDSSISVKTENGETTTPIRVMASNVSSESDTSGNDKSKGSTETNETQNTDATEDEMFKGDTQTGETGEDSDSSSASENLETVEHDAIDSSDTHIHDDVAKARTDLDTLPDIRTEGDNDEETAAE